MWCSKALVLLVTKSALTAHCDLGFSHGAATFTATTAGCKNGEHDYREPAGQRRLENVQNVCTQTQRRCFNLITHFEKFVTDMWSLTTNRKVMLWRSTSDQEYSIDKLVMKACVLFRNERCLRYHLPCSTN